MRLFNRAKEEDGGGNADQQVHVIGDAPATPPANAVPSPVGAPAPESDTNAAELDATVKEMSEKIARLSSSLESVSTERASFEEKVERMEDRMRKLSSLTEMMSAQYNPFIGDEPAERARLKANGAAMAPLEQKPAKAKAAPAEPEAAVATPAPVEDADPAPVEDADAAPDPVAAPVADAHADVASAAAPAAHRLDAVPPGFVGNMLLLNWSSMLLKAARSRDGMRQIATYYHDLGWIGESVRDALVAYSEGLACESEEPEHDWRADAELHERSLLFIEKLKGGPA